MSEIKICGLYRDEDIDYVNALDPDYVGFIIDFPKSHRSINLDRAEALIKKLKKSIKSVCVFVNAPIDFIAQFDFADIIQLHGDEDNSYILKLKERMPKTEIWKAFKIKCDDDIKKAQNSVADMVLLDSGYGTGEVFDWSIISKFNRKFILAGGINAENINSAVEKLSPFAIDLSSGVETDKIKDFGKIKKVIDIVRSKENE